MVDLDSDSFKMFLNKERKVSTVFVQDITYVATAECT